MLGIMKIEGSWHRDNYATQAVKMADELIKELDSPSSK